MTRVTDSGSRDIPSEAYETYMHCELRQFDDTHNQLQIDLSRIEIYAMHVHAEDSVLCSVQQV